MRLMERGCCHSATVKKTYPNREPRLEVRGIDPGAIHPGPTDSSCFRWWD